MSHPILQDIESFCTSSVIPYLEQQNWAAIDCQPLRQQMAKLGLFGAAIAPEFGGGHYPAALNIPINRLLSRFWLAIPAIYGIHARASQYLSRFGSDQQQQHYLPSMATGEWIAAHAYHEKSKRAPEQFDTRLYCQHGKYRLSGRKEWVLNAAIANLVIVIAKNDIHGGCSAVIVTPGMVGLTIHPEHHRRGLQGVSLTAITFDDIEITPDRIIGGVECDVSTVACGYQPAPSLNFAARASGIADALVQQTRQHLQLELKDSVSRATVYHQWGRIRMLQESIQAHFEFALIQHREERLTQAAAYRTKAACSMSLTQLVHDASRLCGGNGYAGQDGRLIQLLSDAESLCYIDTPDDILVTLSAQQELGPL